MAERHRKMSMREAAIFVIEAMCRNGYGEKLEAMGIRLPDKQQPPREEEPKKD